MSQEEPKVTLVEYILGFCSFIPVAGVVIGVIAIVFGALKFKAGGWKVVLLGVMGILFTIILYASIFFFALSGKNSMLDEVHRKMAQGNLRQCVLALEFYHQVHGEYPDKLEALGNSKQPFDMGLVNFYDRSEGLVKGMKHQLFYYEKTPDGIGYYLLGRGVDDKPFTGDDLFPELSPDELTHSGFKKK
jgi:hypothetical protein